MGARRPPRGVRVRGPAHRALSRTGCPGMWDNITCWKPAHVGEIVLVSCPELFQILNPDQGGFPAGACSGHTQCSPRLLWDKLQGHRVPCRQVVPAPELTSRRGMKPLSSCTQDHGACPQTWLPSPRGDTSSWARQGWALRCGLKHFPSWGRWARHSPLCAPFPRGMVAGEPREAHGHRSAQSWARGKAPR